MAEKVVVGMSGGVDSSVAAYLLKEQGYDVMGATMQIWQDEDNITMEHEGGCCGWSAVDDARRVAFRLDIPYYVMNFKTDFKKYVIDYFVDEYLHGRTPNPCIACNRYVKWESLLKRSMEIGADYIATGHYARIIKLENGRYTIRNSVTVEKDQTYASFIEEESDTKCMPGNFILEDGEVVGKHKGITHYTIGQRKGLGVTFGKPMFVKEIKADTNEIVLCENDALFTKEVIVENVNYMAVESINEPVRLVGKIRYSHKGAPCVVEAIDQNTIKCTFDEPQRAVTPGQAAVFYMDDYVYCGGVIK